jgi:hypothetical protein
VELCLHSPMHRENVTFLFIWDCHDGRCDEHVFLGCRAVQFKEIVLFRPVSCFAYSSTLKIEATYSSDTLVDFQRTARDYIPEDRTLHDFTLETRTKQQQAFREFNLLSTVFWDVMPCNPTEVYRCFGRKYCLHLQAEL